MRYSVSERAARAAAWRRLQKASAVNIEPGLWGVRAGGPEAEQLEAVAALIKDAGGEASIEEIGWHPEAEVALSSRMERACERLWDELFNALELHAATRELALGPDASAADSTDLADLERLFDDFATLAARDLVQSRALERAEAELMAYAEGLVAAATPDPAQLAVPPRGRGRRVQVRARGPRSDDTVAFVAQVRPAIDPRWALAFRAFEDRTFAPDPTRPALRAGTFRWVADPASEADAVAALARRVRLFESTLD